MINHKNAGIISATVIALMVLCPARAQTDNEVAIKKLEDQIKIIELENKVDALHQAGLAAILPKSNTKGLEGKITLDKDGDFYRKIVIQKAIDELLAEFNPTGLNAIEKIYFFSGGFDQNKVGTARAYKTLLSSFDTNSDALLADLDRIKKIDQTKTGSTDTAQGRFGIAEVGVVLSAASGILGSVSDISGYFKTDKTYEGEDIPVSSIEIALALAPKFIELKKQLIIPHLSTKQASPLLDAYGVTKLNAATLATARDEAMALNTAFAALNAAEIKKSSNSVATLEGDLKTADKDAAKAIEKNIAAEKKKIAELSSRKDVNALLTNIAKWSEDFAKVESELLGKQANGEFLLAQLSAYENYGAATKAALLTISVAGSGAASVVSTGKFRNDRLTYLSGLRVFGTITDQDGQVLAILSKATTKAVTEKEAFGVETIKTDTRRNMSRRK